MYPILASYTVSLADLARNSNEIAQQISCGPVAVLDKDRTVFYLVGTQQLQTWMAQAVTSAPSDRLVVTASGDAAAPTFREAALRLLDFERQRVLRGEFGEASVQIIRNRLDVHILPVLGDLPLPAVQQEQLQMLLSRLGEAGSSTTTISQYMVIVRKVLKLALSRKWISEIPEIPRVRIHSKPRSTFSVAQYRQILRGAKQLVKTQSPAPCVKQGDGRRERFWVTAKYRVMRPDMYWLVGFMANSFIRPSDIRTLKHKHVEVVRGERVYLKLNLPTTKKHDKPIVTLRPAVRIYEAMLAQAQAQGRGSADDYLFLPDEPNRAHALAILNFWFKWLLRDVGISLTDNLDQSRTLYCLRHTAITFRLLYGQGIDMLTLARNARTSVDMIENFYASTLAGEMNVGMLQSRRAQRGR